MNLNFPRLEKKVHDFFEVERRLKRVVLCYLATQYICRKGGKLDKDGNSG